MAVVEGWRSFGKRRKINFQKLQEYSSFGFCERDACLRCKKEERDKERERELNTHAPGGFSKFADHGIAAREKERVTTRGRENDPRRGWKSITERKRETRRERAR